MSAHPDVMLARHPFLPVFRSLRNAVVSNLDDDEVRTAVPAAAPLQDCYFSGPKLRLLDAQLGGSLDLEFDDDEWPALLRAATGRCSLESPDLAPHLGRLRAGTYREMVEQALALVGDARGVASRRWVGFGEPWILDFAPMLARAFPDARFLVLLRDPRAVVASMKGIARTHPDEVVNTVSYGRHWRKYVALLTHLADDPAIAGRLRAIRYEDLLQDPERVMTEVCRFLAVDPDPQMLDARSYVDWGTGGAWSGNSSFGTEAGVLDRTAAERWRRTLAPDVANLVEWLCGPDMRLAGYEPDGGVAAGDALATLADESPRYSNWRSDLGDPLADGGAELVRRALLDPSVSVGADLIRQCFLFPEVRDRLLAKAPTAGAGR